MSDESDILSEARDRYQDAVDHDAENREEMLDDLRFCAGEQWDPTEKREREAQGRPCLTINRMPQFVRQVTGDIRANRPSIRVLPVDDGADPDTAEVYNGLVRHIESQSDAATAYQMASESAASGGLGHFRVLNDYAGPETFDQELLIKPIPNPFAVVWDPDSREPTRADAKYCFVTEVMTVAKFREMYPDARQADFDGGDRIDPRGDWFMGEKIRIAEYWCKKPVKMTKLLLADGRVVDGEGLSADEKRALGVVREAARESHKVVYYKISGVDVLEGPIDWPGVYIPIVPVLGEEKQLGERVVRHGAIRYAKDAQRLYNYWRSAMAERVALAPKSPFVGTIKNFENLHQWWRQANTRNMPFLPYNPDPANAGQAPQRQSAPTISTAEANEVALAADDMKATTGIYDAALGAKSNETSGKAIMARQKESDISTFAYIDNLARAIRHAGRILVDLIPKVYDSERVVRLLGEDGTVDTASINRVVMGPDGPMVENDLSVGRYDVEVATGPSYATKRAEAADAMMAFMQANPQMAGLIGDLIAKNMDWPGADEIAKRLRRALPPGLADPVEGEEPRPQMPPDPMVVMEMAHKDAELEGKALDNARKKRELAGFVQPNVMMPEQAPAF